MDIVELLPTGEANAIPSKELAARCGFRSVRDLQSFIESERCAGKIIASKSRNGGGYFKPADISELRSYVRTCEARARNTFRSLNGARKALKLLERKSV